MDHTVWNSCSVLKPLGLHLGEGKVNKPCLRYFFVRGQIAELIFDGEETSKCFLFVCAGRCLKSLKSTSAQVVTIITFGLVLLFSKYGSHRLYPFLQEGGLEKKCQAVGQALVTQAALGCHSAVCTCSLGVEGGPKSDDTGPSEQWRPVRAQPS